MVDSYIVAEMTLEYVKAMSKAYGDVISASCSVCPGGLEIDFANIGEDSWRSLCLNFDKDSPRLVLWVDGEAWAELEVDENVFENPLDDLIKWGDLTYRICER